MRTPEEQPGWRWVILAVGTSAQSGAATVTYGLPVILPAFQEELDTSLQVATAVVAAPWLGILTTLVLWGALADRIGERTVMATGMALTSAALFAASRLDSAVGLFGALALAGGTAASVYAASGRAVMGWFPVQGRGMAMGIRQTSMPLGGALAALVMPPLADSHGVDAALLFPAVLCAVMALAVLLLVADPPPAKGDTGYHSTSPYRGSFSLARVHASSALLVVPQVAIATFTTVYLVSEREWDAVAAGQFMIALHLAGAGGRVAAGIWSDRVRSRLRPMQQLAVASSALMALVAAGAHWQAWWIVVVFIVAGVVTVSDNGLAYTAVAELAGRGWAGRALGVQNTGQHLVGLAMAPVIAVVIGQDRYALGFAVVVLFPLAAIWLTPVAADPVQRAASTPSRQR